MILVNDLPPRGKVAKQRIEETDFLLLIFMDYVYDLFVLRQCNYTVWLSPSPSLFLTLCWDAFIETPKMLVAPCLPPPRQC